MALKGLIFDFDGLIVDTELPEYQAWQEIYDDYSVQLEVNLWAQAVGASYARFDPVAHLEKLTNQTLPRQELFSRQRQRSDELAANLTLLPGVLPLLKSASEYGLKMGIASSSDRQWVQSHISTLGIVSYFGCILTADDVHHIKPQPDLYQSALHCLGLQPAEAIAFEDSPNGITAARAAQLFCVAVPNPITRQLDLTHANSIVDSLAAITIQKLLTITGRTLN